MKRLIALVVALLISSGAFAERECTADVDKFCKGKDRSEIGACMEQHEDELSPGCKANREAAKACADDLQKFCGDVQKYKERAACMEQHEDELSPGCKASREEMQ